MSAMQFETYREIGLKALKRATVSGERPQAVTYIISMQEEMTKAASEKEVKTFEKSHESYRKHRNQQHLFNRETGTGILFSAGKSMPRADVFPVQGAIGQPPKVLPPRQPPGRLGPSRCAGSSSIQRVETGPGSLSSRRWHHAGSHSSRTLDDEP